MLITSTKTLDCWWFGSGRKPTKTFTVNGSSRIELVKGLVRRFCGSEPSRSYFYKK